MVRRIQAMTSIEIEGRPTPTSKWNFRPARGCTDRGGLVGVVTSAIKLVRRSDASLDGLGLADSFPKSTHVLGSGAGAGALFVGSKVRNPSPRPGLKYSGSGALIGSVRPGGDEPLPNKVHVKKGSVAQQNRSRHKD